MQKKKFHILRDIWFWERRWAFKQGDLTKTRRDVAPEDAYSGDAGQGRGGDV